MKNLKIVLTFNYHSEKKYGLVSREFDTPETIGHIKNAIKKNGHNVHLIEADENFYPKLKKLKNKRNVDFVFNYSVGIYGRGRETHVPAICEMLQIPYSASDILSTALCQDKPRSKDILIYHNIKTARYQLFKTPDDNFQGSLDFPVIVKYAYQGSSMGLTDDKGIVHNKKKLLERVKALFGLYPSPVIAEEYIGGREFTVGFYGNYPKITFFPLVEMMARKEQDQKEWVANSSNQPRFVCRDLKNHLKEKIYKTCQKIVEIFELRDWGRIDLRIADKNNEIYILEINNCAHLADTCVYYLGARGMGLSHEGLIINMLNSALSRCGFE